MKLSAAGETGKLYTAFILGRQLAGVDFGYWPLI